MRTKPIKKSSWTNPLVSREASGLIGLSKNLNIINTLTAKRYLRRFHKAAQKHGFKKYSLSQGRQTYYLGEGPHKMVIISGIHGEERAGPVALLTWLEETKRDRLIPKGVCLMICPMVAHNAWDNEVRLENRANLNNAWIRPMAPDYIHELKTEIINQEPRVFLDLHEDETIVDGEPYICKNKNNFGLIYSLKEALGVGPRKGLWHNPSDSEHRGTSEAWAWSIGCRETATIETPLKKLLARRVGFNLAVIKWVIKNIHLEMA